MAEAVDLSLFTNGANGSTGVVNFMEFPGDYLLG